MFLNNFIMRITRYFYKFYYKILRRNRWDPQCDFLIPYESIMHNDIPNENKWNKINKLRKKVFINTITLVECGYYYAENHKVIIDSKTPLTNSIFYSKKTDVSNFREIEYDTNIEVVNSDCLEEGVRLLDLGYNPAILNMANRHFPGGGTINGSIGQEEDVFRRTNIFRLLYQYAPIGKRIKIEMSREQYPMDRNYGGIYSPGITIFRESAQNGYALMKQPRTVAFISVAGINRPTLTSDGMIDNAHLEMIKNKVRTILRIGLHNGHDSLVLGAFGCGAFRNPPKHIALLFYEVLKEEEFVNKYKHISFAILEDSNSFHKHNRLGNLKYFKQQFK